MGRITNPQDLETEVIYKYINDADTSNRNFGISLNEKILLAVTSPKVTII